MLALDAVRSLVAHALAHTLTLGAVRSLVTAERERAQAAERRERAQPAEAAAAIAAAAAARPRQRPRGRYFLNAVKVAA